MISAGVEPGLDHTLPDRVIRICKSSKLEK